MIKDRKLFFKANYLTFKGSPSVSPMTVALYNSVNPLSDSVTRITLLALFQAAPVFDNAAALWIDDVTNPDIMASRAITPKNTPMTIGKIIPMAAGMTSP